MRMLVAEKCSSSNREKKKNPDNPLTLWHNKIINLQEKIFIQNMITAPIFTVFSFLNFLPQSIWRVWRKWNKHPIGAKSLKPQSIFLESKIWKKTFLVHELKYIINSHMNFMPVSEKSVCKKPQLCYDVS